MSPNALKQRRQLLNLTQVQVAKAIGVSQPTYQNYESGNALIPEDKARRLMTVLNLTLAEIMGQPRLPAQPTRSPGIPDEMYWGEVVAHFSKGEALVLPIDYRTYGRLFQQLQRDDCRFVFVDVPLLNRMVAIRKAAITDLYLSDDASGTYGPEHKKYRVTPFFMTPFENFWAIADELLTDADRDELDDEYGEHVVTEVARSIGLDMPRDVDGLIEEGKVKPEERDLVLKEAAKTRESAEYLSRTIGWQLSNGTFRREWCDYDSDFLRYWWIADGMDPEGQGAMIIVDVEDAQTAFINPDSLDYISIPAHRFQKASAEEEAKINGSTDDEEVETLVKTKPATKPKRSQRKRSAKQ